MSGKKKVDLKITVLGKPIYILSISGGKDSLAMWLAMHEHGVDNMVPVTFIGGWDWDCAMEEIKRVELITGDRCRKLDSTGYFDNVLSLRGWPSWHVRWCTGYKRDQIQVFINSIARAYPEHRVLSAVGIAADEVKRQKKNGVKSKNIILPLVALGLKERDCLRVCAQAGVTWGGHYYSHDRMSCWCCPWQKKVDYRELYFNNRKKWNLMRAMDETAPEGRKFHWGKNSLEQMEEIFKADKAQGGRKCLNMT